MLVIKSHFTREFHPDGKPFLSRLDFYVQNPTPAMDHEAFYWEYVGSVSHYDRIDSKGKWGVCLVAPYPAESTYPVMTAHSLADAVAAIRTHATAILTGVDRRNEESYHRAHAMVETAAAVVEFQPDVHTTECWHGDCQHTPQYESSRYFN